MTYKPMAAVGQLEAPKTIGIQGRQHPSADGLVDRAHRHTTDRGLYLIGTELQVVDTPRAENNMTAIVLATAIFSDGQNTYRFMGLGDANPTNCTSANTAAAFPRMAETRALSRALSVALNVPEAVAEELAENPQAFINQAPAQPMGGYQAPQGGSNGGGWNGIIMFGRNKDKHISDLSVDLKDLDWLANNLKQRDKVTPDYEKIQVVQAEIARRNGMQPGMPQQMMQPGFQQPQMAAQPPQQMMQPGFQQPGMPPQMMQQPMGQPQQMVQPQAPAGQWKATTQDITELLMLGGQRQMNYDAIKGEAARMFGQPDPAQLPYDQFNMLRVHLGGVAK